MMVRCDSTELIPSTSGDDNDQNTDPHGGWSYRGSARPRSSSGEPSIYGSEPGSPMQSPTIIPFMRLPSNIDKLMLPPLPNSNIIPRFAFLRHPRLSHPKIDSDKLSGLSACSRVRDCEGLIALVFPSGRIGDHAIDMTLLGQLKGRMLGGKMYDTTQNRWKSFSNYDGGEQAMSDWLTSLVVALQTTTFRDASRTWTPQQTNISLLGSSHRKPDIMLIRLRVRLTSALLGWWEVVSLVETTTGSFTDTVTNTVFLKAMVALVYGEASSLGFDGTIRRESNAKISRINVGDVPYKPGEPIFETQAWRGRATRVWTARAPGDSESNYLIKDCWVQSARAENEIKILQAISDIGVPIFVDGGNVINNDIPDTTAIFRPGFGGHSIMNHVRIVTQPIGEPLIAFTSIKELVGVFIDIFQVHKELCEVKKILHRDISYGNILLQPPRNTNPLESSSFDTTRKRGLLIDFGCATHIDKTETTNPGDRTGTAPFMALQLLRAETQHHEPRHDIESMFTVFLYAITKIASPGTWNDNKLTIDVWFKPIPFSLLATIKTGHFAFFEQDILGSMPSYFQALQPTLLAMFDILYPPLGGPGSPPHRQFLQSHGTHEAMLECLKRAYDALPDVEIEAGDGAHPDEPGKRLVTASCETQAAKRRKLSASPSTDSSSMVL